MTNEPSAVRKNRLAESMSPYLTEAADQPVYWFEWGAEAFEIARREQKPILLDIGAVWCHWCHVIDRESYSDEGIASIINDHFVPVKVDRDQRPDIDSRYQKAVQAVSGQGGWPLTAFLTPEGRVFYGGTYFPPDGRHGHPGMRQLLPEIAQFYHENNEDVAANADKIEDHLRDMDDRVERATLRPNVLAPIETDIRERYDEIHGGFGTRPKFPSTTALEYLAYLWSRNTKDDLRKILTTTLTAMARGGFRDQLGGAFHRYSVDERWHVPHFEILSHVNADLMKVYLYCYQLFREEDYKCIANRVADYVLRKAADTKNGGFYASQDADYSLDDDGDYWTWTVEEVESVLDSETSRVMMKYFDITTQGDMTDSPQRNVLHISSSPTAIAEELDVDTHQVEQRIEEGIRKMLKAREQRPAPFIDRTIYTDWSGMMAEAFLEASRILDRADLQRQALRTLDRLWAKGWREDLGMLHQLGPAADTLPGLLSDQVFYAKACLTAYEYSTDTTHLDRAIRVTEWARNSLWNTTGGGFFDRVTSGEEQGFLSLPSQPFQDAPTPGENAVAAFVLQRLYLLTGTETYRSLAEKTLERFGGTAPKYGSFAAMFALASSQIIREPIRMVVNDEGNSTLWNCAVQEKYPMEVLIRGTHGSRGDAVPGMVSEKIKHFSGVDSTALAFICDDRRCSEPLRTTEQFRETLKTFRAP